jgi:hypothetical protein
MNAHLVAGFRSDLEVGMGYLRISKSIKDMGEVRQARGVYVCTVKLTKPFKEVADQLSARFGRFVQLRKV